MAELKQMSESQPQESEEQKQSGEQGEVQQQSEQKKQKEAAAAPAVHANNNAPIADQFSATSLAATRTQVDSMEAFNIGFGRGAKKKAKPIPAYRGYEASGLVPSINSRYVFQQDVTRSFIMSCPSSYDLGHEGLI